MAGFDDEVGDDFVEGADGFGERGGLVAEGVEGGFYWGWGRGGLVFWGEEVGCVGSREGRGGNYVRFGNSAAPCGEQRGREVRSFFCEDVSAATLPLLLRRLNVGAEGAAGLCSHRTLLHRWMGRGG